MFASLPPSLYYIQAGICVALPRTRIALASIKSPQPFQYWKVRQEYILASGFIYIGHDWPRGYVVSAVEWRGSPLLLIFCEVWTSINWPKKQNILKRPVNQEATAVANLQQEVPRYNLSARKRTQKLSDHSGQPLPDLYSMVSWKWN